MHVAPVGRIASYKNAQRAWLADVYFLGFLQFAWPLMYDNRLRISALGRNMQGSRTPKSLVGLARKAINQHLSLSGGANIVVFDHERFFLKPRSRRRNAYLRHDICLDVNESLPGRCFYIDVVNQGFHLLLIHLAYFKCVRFAAMLQCNRSVAHVETAVRLHADGNAIVACDRYLTPCLAIVISSRRKLCRPWLIGLIEVKGERCVSGTDENLLLFQYLPCSLIFGDAAKVIVVRTSGKKQQGKEGNWPHP